MDEAITLKITSQQQSDFDKVAKVLEARYKVLAMSRPIFDSNTGTYHIFLNLEAKE